MMSAEMPATVMRQHAAPPEHVLWSIPSRGPGQALVRVTAAPISPLDLLCASGTSYFGAPRLPYIPGVQGIGIVIEADVLAPGQRVWFSCDAGMKPGDGSMALYCVIDESSALVLPDQVDDDLAGALGLSAIAAWMALTWRGHLQSGEQVLVLGATNNALTNEQKAGALTEILTHAAAGRCMVEREMVPLARAAEAWERQAACARRKLILVP